MIKQNTPCKLCRHKKYMRAPFTLRYYGGGEAAIFICKVCGMTPAVSSYPARYRQVLEEEYYQEGMYSAFNSIDSYTGAIRERLDKVNELLPLEGRTLLDVGCGQGVLLKIAKGYGAIVYGIEPSKCEAARLNQEEFNVFQGLIEDAPTPKNKYDIVTLTWVLDAMNDPVSALSKIRGLIKENGLLHVSISSTFLMPFFARGRFGIPIPFQKYRRAFISKNISDTHPFHFTRNTLIACLELTGFKVVSISDRKERRTTINARPTGQKPFRDLDLENPWRLWFYFIRWPFMDQVRLGYKSLFKLRGKVKRLLKTSKNNLK